MLQFTIWQENPQDLHANVPSIQPNTTNDISPDLTVEIANNLQETALPLATRIDDLLKVPVGSSENQLNEYAENLAPKVIQFLENLIRQHEFAELVKLYHTLMQNPNSHAFRKLNYLIRAKELRPLWEKILTKKENYAALPNIPTFAIHETSSIIKTNYKIYNQKNQDKPKTPPLERHPFYILAGYYYRNASAPLIQQLEEIWFSERQLRNKKHFQAYQTLNQLSQKQNNPSLLGLISIIKNYGTTENEINLATQNNPDYIKTILLPGLKNIYTKLESETQKILEIGIYFGDFACMEGLFHLNNIKIHNAKSSRKPLTTDEINNMLELANRFGGRLHLSEEYFLLASTHYSLSLHHETFTNHRPRSQYRLFYSSEKYTQNRDAALKNALTHIETAITLSIHSIPMRLNARHELTITKSHCNFLRANTLHDFKEALILDASKYLNREVIDTAIAEGKMLGEQIVDPNLTTLNSLQLQPVR